MKYSRALFLYLVFAMGCSSVAQAGVIRGNAIAIDGDTLAMTGARIRLYAIDAPEKAQTCQRDGQDWACGMEATATLARLIEGREVACQQVTWDRYGRMVATCTVGNLDLGEVMVRAGMAVALPQFSDVYVRVEAGARTQKLGIWNSTFETPADYRAGRQQEFAKPKPAVPTVRRSESRSQVYYRNCHEAWAAGAAPIYRGQPGYRPEMDGDGDGIACEPFRGKRR